MNKFNPIKIGKRVIQFVGLIGSNGDLINATNNALDINLSNHGFVDENNSSAIPLGANETFTGVSVNIEDFAIIYVNVKSDVASAIDGLSVQQSTDGVDWEHIDTFSIQAATAKTFSFQAAAKFLKVEYTNGSTNQSYFRLQTVLKKTYGKPSSHRIQDSIADDDDAELVKAVLTGKNNGTFVNVRTTVDGNLTISDNSSGLSIAQGNVTGASFIHKFGNAPDFDTSDGEVDIWDGAEDGEPYEAMTYTFSTIADIDSLSSESTNDTQNIEIQGLDADYNLVTQTIQLSGQTRVPLSTNLIRVFRLKNVSSTNLVGHVFCFINTTLSGGIPTTPANIRAVIHPDNNQTEMAIYTIPAGKTGYMNSWYASTSGSSKNSNYLIKLKARSNGGVFQLKHKSAIADNSTSSYQHNYLQPEIFIEKTDIIMTAEMLAAGATGASISAGFEIVLIDN